MTDDTYINARRIHEQGERIAALEDKVAALTTINARLDRLEEGLAITAANTIELKYGLRHG